MKLWCAGFGLVFLFLACNKSSKTVAAETKNECEEDKDCDDHIFCTKDSCVLLGDNSKKCLVVPSDDLCDPLEKCVLDQGCVPLQRIWCLGRQDGEKCVPDYTIDRCAVGDGVCMQGECVYPLRECEIKQCSVLKGCHPETGECEYEPVSGDRCDDKNSCTVGDFCENGVCVGKENLVCDDQQKCTNDRCDPEKGCVFDAIPECCPNGIVEEGESCDAGQYSGQAGWGCSSVCTYIPVPLASPPAGGRFPHVAWLSSQNKGLVVYTRQSSAGDERYIVVRTVTERTQFSSERPIDTVPWRLASGEQSQVEIFHEVTVSPLPSKDGYFIAALVEHGVAGYVVDKDGGLKVGPLVVPYKGLPISSVRSGTGQDRIFVAWAEKISCDSDSSYVVARLATFKATTSSLSLLGEVSDISPGTCENQDRALVGSVCADGEEAFITLSLRKRGPDQQRSSMYGGMRVLSDFAEFVEFYSVQGNPDMLPPLCANHPEGYLSLFVARDQDSDRVVLFSIITERKGNGTGFLPQEIHSLARGETGVVLYPFIGTLLPYVSNNYLFIAPALAYNPQSFAPPQAIVLDAQGTKISGPQPFALQDPQRWTFSVSGTQVEDGHLLVAWFEAEIKNEIVSYHDNIVRAMFIDPAIPPVLTR